MKKLSPSEEQVLLAVWAARPPATRHEIELKLPLGCKWADSTVLNFLYRLEEKGFLRCEKQGNKNRYTPTVSKAAYQRQAAARQLNALFDGDPQALLEALLDSGALELNQMEQLRDWLEEQIFALEDYDQWEP